MLDSHLPKFHILSASESVAIDSHLSRTVDSFSLPIESWNLYMYMGCGSIFNDLAAIPSLLRINSSVILSPFEFCEPQEIMWEPFHFSRILLIESWNPYVYVGCGSILKHWLSLIWWRIMPRPRMSEIGRCDIKLFCTCVWVWAENLSALWLEKLICNCHVLWRICDIRRFWTFREWWSLIKNRRHNYSISRLYSARHKLWNTVPHLLIN